MAKDKNMNTTTTSELKAVAKAVGASLKRAGHPVPHSNVLHALAAALDKRDWHKLKASVAGQADGPSSDTHNGLPTAYNDAARFWVRLAYLNGTPLSVLPATSEAAIEAARALVGPVKSGVLKWGAWNVPADLTYADSTVDAGNFLPQGKPAVGTLNLHYLHGQVPVEVGFHWKRGWFVTESGADQLRGATARLVTDEQVLKATDALASLALPGPAVRAKFWTDDRAFETEFDAQAYLMQANDAGLIGIMLVGYVGDARTDAVAEYMCDRRLDAYIEDAFGYLSAQQKSRTHEFIGFECHIDPESFLRWMHAHKPELLASHLCAAYDVDLVQAEEEEVRGRWDWLLRSEGEASDMSFETREEAELDAYRRLGLLEIAISDAPGAPF